MVFRICDRGGGKKERKRERKKEKKIVKKEEKKRKGTKVRKVGSDRLGGKMTKTKHIKIKNKKREQKSK